MNKRFGGLTKILYTWTDRDQVCAINIRTWYDDKKAEGLSHGPALLAIKKGRPNHLFEAGPGKLLIPMITQADPEKLWDKLVVARQTVELSLDEFRTKAPPASRADQYISRCKVWKIYDIEQLEWQKLEGTARSAFQGAPNLTAGFEALNKLDKDRFPSALYSKTTTRFEKSVRRVFEFWGNTKFRAYATRQGHGFDYAHQTKTIAKLPTVVEGVSLEYVPVFNPVLTSHPASPGKNKVYSTPKSDFKTHVAKLKLLADENYACRVQLDTLRGHQSRAQSVAKMFDVFSKIYPSAPHAALAQGAAAMRRVAALPDTEVFKKDPTLFASPPPVSFGGILKRVAPSEPPLEHGIATTREMLKILGNDPDAAAAAFEWSEGILKSGRGLGATEHTFKELAFAIATMSVADYATADHTLDFVDLHMAKAPDFAATSVAELKGAGPTGDEGLVDVLLRLNGTKIVPWGKFVPAVAGNFAGPPSLGVALVNAAGYMGQVALKSDGASSKIATRYFNWTAKLITKDAADKIKAACGSNDRKALLKALTDLETPAGDRPFKPVRSTTSMANNVMSSPAWFGVVSLFQISTTIDAIFYQEAPKQTVPLLLHATTVGLGGAQTVTMVYETFLQTRAALRGIDVAAKTAKTLQQCNIVLGGALSLLGAVQAVYQGSEAYKKGDSVQVGVSVVKFVGNIGLFACLFIPPPAGPIVQAGIMLIMIGTDIVLAITEGGKEVEISHAVNNQLRGVAKMGANKQHLSLAVFLTASERDSLKAIESACNLQEIKHVSAGQAIGLPQDKEHIRMLQECGFTLPQISNLMGRMLSQSDLP